MFCSKCGAIINGNESFCGVCGNKIETLQTIPQLNDQLPNNNLNQINQSQLYNQNSYQSMNSANQSYQYNQNISNNNLNQQQYNMYNNNSNLGQYNQYNNNLNQYQYNSYNNVIDDEVLINAYVGNNSDKLVNGGFSLCTLFFGYIYAMYRKMWILGFLWLVANVISTLFLGGIATYISFVLNIYFAIKFKDMYLKHVKEEVHLIKMNNQGKSQNELITLCSKKG